MNYLGLDFGTSNCVACAPAASGEIAFVPLEGESILLPTVLFVNRAMSTNLEVDEDELDQRVKEAMAEERRRRASDEAELLEILLQFDARNKPKPPVDPVRPLEQDVQDQGASYQEELQGFERLQQQYAKDEVEYQQLLKEFQHNRIHYETEQRQSFPKTVPLTPDLFVGNIRDRETHMASFIKETDARHHNPGAKRKSLEPRFSGGLNNDHGIFLSWAGGYRFHHLIATLC